MFRRGTVWQQRCQRLLPHTHLLLRVHFCQRLLLLPAPACAICLLLPEACPDAQRVSVALEFGTLPIQAVLNALRGDHWLHRRKGDASAAQIAAIKQAVRETFYGDADDWRGMVLGQARTAALQAVCGLQKLGG